jgi:hypothetical protein
LPPLLQADANEVSFSAGRFTVGGSERGIDRGRWRKRLETGQSA